MVALTKKVQPRLFTTFNDVGQILPCQLYIASFSLTKIS